jgi:hypothetical protein
MPVPRKYVTVFAPLVAGVRYMPLKGKINFHIDNFLKSRRSFAKEYRISRRRVPHLSAESTASFGEEYRISRQRVPHLSAKSTASLGKEYFISRRRVLHLLTKSTSSLGGEYFIS